MSAFVVSTRHAVLKLEMPKLGAKRAIGINSRDMYGRELPPGRGFSIGKVENERLTLIPGEPMITAASNGGGNLLSRAQRYVSKELTHFVGSQIQRDTEREREREKTSNITFWSK